MCTSVATLTLTTVLNADARAACMHRQTPQVHNQLCTAVRVEVLQRGAIAQAYTVARTDYRLLIIRLCCLIIQFASDDYGNPRCTSYIICIN